MEIHRILKECLDLLVSVREEDSTGLSDLTHEQIRSLATIEGKIEFLVKYLEEPKPVKISEDTFSNCCGVPIDCDMHLCPACKEGCARVNENNEEVE